MTRVTLDGLLVCRDVGESELVAALLPAHVALTRLEPGCLSFEVEVTADPLVWKVSEIFTDSARFRAHQDRVAASDWGKATAQIERRYDISGAD